MPTAETENDPRIALICTPPDRVTKRIEARVLAPKLLLIFLMDGQTRCFPFVYDDQPADEIPNLAAHRTVSQTLVGFRFPKPPGLKLEILTSRPDLIKYRPISTRDVVVTTPFDTYYGFTGVDEDELGARASAFLKEQDQIVDAMARSVIRGKNFPELPPKSP